MKTSNTEKNRVPCQPVSRLSRCGQSRSPAQRQHCLDMAGGWLQHRCVVRAIADALHAGTSMRETILRRTGLVSPLLEAKHPDAPSVFQPEALLREARRQKNLGSDAVPAICLLDPDGDILRHLHLRGAARRHQDWACYHTDLFVFGQAGFEVGIVACVVGAPFAVLVAEQLFASGCALLVSITSAGQIVAHGPTPYFVLIDRALRDEGTSHHYLPASAFACAPDPALLDAVAAALLALPKHPAVHRGATWTTDAPYRETEAAIAKAHDLGILAVEMEAAALYAFAIARKRDVVCFAHVTNAMAQSEGDFEKGEADGATASLHVLAATAKAWRELRGGFSAP